jgi:hypothetical protein
MQAPTVNEALGVWERGAGMGQAERGLALLGLAHAGAQREALADLSIGARDAALLSLREAMFGPHIDGRANCPVCGEAVEMNFTIDHIRTEPPQSPSLSLQHDNCFVQLRLPTSRDLITLDRHGADARTALLAKCVVSASVNGRPAGHDALPQRALDAAVMKLSEADPQADITIALRCPACAHDWKAPFDIVSYLWTELDAWAMRILHEVHALARAYGWHEADILALSPARRKFYLEMAAP